MSDHDRGAYSPQNDGPRSFDARQSRGGPGGFPTTLVASLVVLAVMIVAIVLFYRSGVRSGHGAPPLGAPLAEIKTPAQGPAPASDEAVGLQIYKAEGAASAPSSTPPTFAPPPEEPRAKPAPVAAAPPPPAAPQKPAVSQKDEIGELLQKAPADTPPPAKPAAVAANASPFAPPEPAAVTPRPVAKPVVKATAKPAVAAVPDTHGAAMAQIGAFSSDALAAKGWTDVSKAFGAAMAGKGRHIEPVQRDGKTLYRAAVTGFASKADAEAFCAKLKAAGRACFAK